MNAGNWLLLERTEHLLPALYHQAEDPDPIRLFDGTVLAACEEESPLLINAQTNPFLLATVQSEPLAWPGLLLEATETTEGLLAHLRHILFMRFDQERRGVLRYSRPRTASYFFPACDAEMLSLWLGPIRRLSWYGGTWHEHADGQDAWQHVENQQASLWRPAPTAHELHLNTAQEQALQHQQGEYFLHQWWKRLSDIQFETARDYMAAGMQCGFASAESLSAYLDLRHANPHAKAPHALPPGADRERLDALARHLAMSTTDKESSV